MTKVEPPFLLAIFSSLRVFPSAVKGFSGFLRFTPESTRTCWPSQLKNGVVRKPLDMLTEGQMAVSLLKANG